MLGCFGLYILDCVIVLSSNIVRHASCDACQCHVFGVGFVGVRCVDKIPWAYSVFLVLAPNFSLMKE